MDKEKIFSTISERLEAEGIKTGPFKRSISTYIDSNLPAEGTEPDDDYFNRHVGVLRSFSGQFNHDVASQVEEFKKNYKPEPAPKPEPSKNEESETIKALRDEIAGLKSRIDVRDEQSRTEALIKKVTSDSSLNVANKNLWRDSVAAVDIEKSDDTASVTAKAKRIYERKVKEYFGDGAVPYGSSGQKGGPAVDKNSPEAKKMREAFKAKMKAQGRL